MGYYCVGYCYKDTVEQVMWAKNCVGYCYKDRTIKCAIACCKDGLEQCVWAKYCYNSTRTAEQGMCRLLLQRHSRKFRGTCVGSYLLQALVRLA